MAVRSGSGNKFDEYVSAYLGREGGGSIDLEVCLSPEVMRALEFDARVHGCCLLIPFTLAVTIIIYMCVCVCITMSLYHLIMSICRSCNAMVTILGIERNIQSI